jgi:hypothetical protein
VDQDGVPVFAGQSFDGGPAAVVRAVVDHDEDPFGVAVGLVG